MSTIVTEIVIVILLLVANGVFAMTEIAIVSSRKGRLRRLADAGDARAQAALDLAESPGRFLATVQIGITLVGVLAGAFGGATLADKLTSVLTGVPLIAPAAREIAFAIVVMGIAYLSLILGELAPKRIGLSNPEGIALQVARGTKRLAALGAPVVTFLAASTEALLRVFGVKPQPEAAISEDEVRVLMAEGMRAGAFNKVESDIVSRVLELDQLRVRDLMTPRAKVIFLNQDDPHEAVWHKIVVSGHSYFPVYSGSRDRVAGIVSVKSIYANLAAHAGVSLKDLSLPPLLVPETLNTLQLLDAFKQSGKHHALVADEFGGITGMVTLNDVMEAMVGELPSIEQRSQPAAKRREDGSWLADGLLDLERTAQAIPGVRFDHADYQTLAGYVSHQLGHIPHEGETFTAQGYLWEVLDMDGHRVDKVLIMPGKSA